MTLRSDDAGRVVFARTTAKVDLISSLIGVVTTNSLRRSHHSAWSSEWCSVFCPPCAIPITLYSGVLRIGYQPAGTEGGGGVGGAEVRVDGAMYEVAGGPPAIASSMTSRNARNSTAWALVTTTAFSFLVASIVAAPKRERASFPPETENSMYPFISAPGGFHWMAWIDRTGCAYRPCPPTPWR